MPTQALLFALTAAIAASVAAGVWAHGRWGVRTQDWVAQVVQAMLYVLLPFITFFVVARTELTAGVGVGILFAYVELTIVGLLAWLAAKRLFGLGSVGQATMVICVIMANTGYLGVPLNSAILGSDELGPAITFDAAVSGPMFYVFGFAIAAAFTTRGEPVGARVRAFLLRNPPLIAVVAALIVPDALAPDVMVDIAEALVFALLPVGFFILGVTLAAETGGGSLRFPPPLTAPAATLVVLRMAVAPALLAGMAAATVSVPDAYLLQAAMPVGINTIVVAHAYDLDLGLASTAVAWSTAVAVVAGLGTLVI